MKKENITLKEQNPIKFAGIEGFIGSLDPRSQEERMEALIEEISNRLKPAPENMPFIVNGKSDQELHDYFFTDYPIGKPVLNPVLSSIGSYPTEEELFYQFIPPHRFDRITTTSMGEHRSRLAFYDFNKKD